MRRALRHQPARRLQPHETAAGGGNADRARPVRGVRHGRHARTPPPQPTRPTSRRPTRPIEGVAGQARKAHRLGRHVEAELRKVGLAEDAQPGPPERAASVRRPRSCTAALVPRPAGALVRVPAMPAPMSFSRNGTPAKGPASGTSFSTGRSIQLDHRVDRRVARGDPRAGGAQHRLPPDLARPDQRRQRRRVEPRRRPPGSRQRRLQRRAAASDSLRIASSTLRCSRWNSGVATMLVASRPRQVDRRPRS